MNIQDYTRQYVQAWEISIENSAKLVIPALTTGYLTYKGLQHYIPQPKLSDVTTPSDCRSPESTAKINLHNEALKRRTNTIRIVKFASGLITLGFVVKQWPLKPLSVFQMNSMGVSAVAIFALSKRAPRPPQKYILFTQMLITSYFCASAIGCGASVLGRLKDLTSNYAQRLFNQ